IGLYEDYRRGSDRQSARTVLHIGEEFVILCFGSVRPYKGISHLVEAFTQLPQSMADSSRLIIAGEGWGQQDSLMSLVQASPRRDRITLMLHFIPDAMIPTLFSAADVVALPYLRTLGSGVANIAMAYGKPIVTSDLDTMRECLSGYSGARFATPGDALSIRDSLVDVYTKHKPGGGLVFEPPANTWDEIARQHRELAEEICHG
ncbi:MAG: glycosyltransferase, partial [Chloroflexi bacterium]|nr:glycosyltransferase [Chloroflexota bacterium]